MLYSEFIEWTGMQFISSDIYHDEIEKAYCNYVGNKEEFCRILVNLSDYPVLIDGFLSSLIWGYEKIDCHFSVYKVIGCCEDIQLERRTLFYTKAAALLAKNLLAIKYPNFNFIIK